MSGSINLDQIVPFGEIRQAIIEPSRHFVTKWDSVFDVNGPQCLITPDKLILEVLSGKDDIEGRRLHWRGELLGDYSG
jgi:hypothetical protein